MASTGGNRPSTLMIAVLFLALVVPMGVTLLAVSRAARPLVCTSCHTGRVAADDTGAGKKADKKADEKPDKKAASPGSHDGLPCIDCHEDRSLNVRAGMGGVKSLAAKAGDPFEPIAMPDATCVRCHNMKGHQPKPGSLARGEHEVHAAKGLPCVQCHRRVIHGEAGAKGDVTFPRPKMLDCLACHKQLVTPGSDPKFVRCPTCHLVDMKPDFHNPSEVWKKKHGPMVMKDGPAMCAGCHGRQAIDEKLEMKDGRTFARNNFWCSWCHMNNRPARHSDIWRIIHKTQALPSFFYCMVCHNSSDKPDPKKVATDLEHRAVQKIWCNRCHAPADDSKHKPAAEWLPFHYQYVKSEGPVQGRCFYCHAVNHCQTCHNSRTAKVLIDKFREDLRAKGIEPPPSPTAGP